MPTRPPRPCNWPGCPSLTRDRYCPRHAEERAQRERQRLSARPSAAQRGYGRAWQRVRGEWLAAHPWCAACGAVGTEVHHIVRLADGGTHHPSNLMTLCASCHHRVTKREADARRRAAEVTA